MIDWDTPASADALPRYEGPAPGFGELLDAARINFDAGSLTTAPEVYRGFYGQQIVAALKAKGITRFRDPDKKYETIFDASQFRPRFGGTRYYSPAQAAAWKAIAEIRRTDPNFLTGLTNDAELEAAALAERKRDFASSSDTLARGGTMASVGAQLVGGLRESLADPQQIFALAATAAIPFGTALKPVAARLFGGAATGPAMQVAMRAIGGGLANVAAAAPILPTIVDRRAEIGEDMDAGDIALELGVAFLGGAAIEGVQMGAGALARGAGQAIEAMSARRQAAALRKIAEQRPLAPDQADALAVLDETARDIGSSPFVPTPAGDAAHAERLTEAVDALENGRPIEPAVFDPGAPPVRPDFQAGVYLEAAKIYARNREAGPLTPDALGAVLGIEPAEARQVLMTLAARDRSVRVRAVTDKTTGGSEMRFSRAPQRRGVVDLLTTIADMGGVESRAVEWRRRDGSTNLIMGNKFIPGAGPLFRKNGAPLDELALTLWELGWFPDKPFKSAGETNRPTPDDVLDLIDRAMRGERIVHPDDVPAIEAEKLGAADDREQAAFLEQGRADMEEWWGSEAGQFFAGDEVLTPALLDQMQPFMAPDRAPEQVWEEWANARQDARIAEAEAAYAEGDGVAENPYDGGDDGGRQNSARDGATGTGPQDGGGPDPVSADAAIGSGGRAETGTVLGDIAAEAAAADALKPFDDPAGDGVAAQVDSLVHDLRADIEGEPALIETGDAVDPAIAERQRIELELRTKGPMRGKTEQADLSDTGLFGQVDAFLTHDGRPTTKADLLAEIDADDAALKAMRDCL